MHPIAVLRSAIVALQTLLTLLKWPAAIIATWIAAHGLLPLFSALLALTQRTAISRWIALGLLVYAAFAWLAHRSVRVRSLLSIAMVLEHELAHLLMAVFIGARVDHLQASAEGSGHIRSTTKHWLVYIAPYVLPLALLAPLLLLEVGGRAQPLLLFTLGIALGFHAHSSWIETHRQQTDLGEVGWSASVLLISSAHVLALLWLCGYLTGSQRPLAIATRVSLRTLFKLTGQH